MFYRNVIIAILMLFTIQPAMAGNPFSNNPFSNNPYPQPKPTPERKKEVVYLTLAEGLAKALKDGVGIGVVRSIPKSQYAHFAEYSKSKNVIFCVADDDDERVKTGAWLFPNDILYLLAPQALQSQPQYSTPARGGC